MGTENFNRKPRILSDVLRRVLVATLLCLISVSSVSAQTANRTPQYRLGSGDRLSVVFFGKHVGDLSGAYEVDGAGLISMPLVGSIRLEGMTVPEAEAAIKSAYQPDYVKNPRPSIQVLNYRPFYIMGEVTTNLPEAHVCPVSAYETAMRIFSSAENRRRVARRMSLMTFSARSFVLPDFCLIFAP